MPNALTASFGFDLEPLRTSGAQAVSIGKDVAAKVQNALAQASKSSVNWGAISRQREQAMAFLNPRGPRTARDFRPAPPGKYSLDEVENVATSRRSLRGVGAGLTAVAAAHQLAAAYIQADAAAAELNRKVDSITRLTGAGAFRGVAEMETNLKEAASALEEIQMRSRIENQNIFGKAVRFVRQTATGDSDSADAEKVARLRAQAAKDVDDIAQKQESLNEAERQSVMYSERQGLILKAEVAHRERLGHLAEIEAAAGINNPAARNAENDRFQNEVKSINLREDAADREVQLENEIGRLGQSNLTIDQQRVAAAKLRLAALQAELNIEGNSERAARLNAKIAPAETEVWQGQYAESKKPWEQKAAEQQARQDYQNFVARQMPSGPNAYLSHPDAYNRRDIMGNRVDPAGNVIGPAGKTPESGPAKPEGGVTKEDINSIVTAINKPDWVK